MAELILKVGDSEDQKGYMDGDILCAFSDKRIFCTHAQNICNPRNVPFNTSGYREINTLPYFMFQEFYQYHFIRVSEKEVKRVDWDGNEEIFSDKTQQQIYVQEYIDRRRKSPKHLIFGSEKNEHWFGGKSDFSQTRIDNVWSFITAYTGKVKADHKVWPIGIREPFDFLPLGLDSDLTDDEANDLVKPVTETQLIDKVETDVIISKRKNFIPWQDMPLISPISIAKINNVNTSVDKREQYPINLTKHLQEVK